jgi:hypothetical protein
MLERKREVVAEHSTYYVCDVHGWDFTGVDEDVCPVCFGESLERDRIVQCLDMALFWALGNPQEPKDEIWSAEQTIKFAKKLITGELSVVRLKDSNE